jgi:hypothetical protein
MYEVYPEDKPGMHRRPRAPTTPTCRRAGREGFEGPEADRAGFSPRPSRLRSAVIANVDWNAEMEAAFEEKLGRTRDKGELLRAQGGALLESAD